MNLNDFPGYKLCQKCDSLHKVGLPCSPRASIQPFKPPKVEFFTPNRHDDPQPPHEIDPDPKLQSPKPKRHKQAALECSNAGEREGICRVRIRFTGYRCRPLDPDNFAGGCKNGIDALRKFGLIEGDEPWRIIFETEQFKVRHYKDEKTVIEIEYP